MQDWYKIPVITITISSSDKKINDKHKLMKNNIKHV